MFASFPSLYCRPYQEPTPPGNSSADALDLDPIDCAGGLNTAPLDNLIRTKPILTFAVKAERFLHDEQFVKDLCDPKLFDDHRRPSTGVKWRAHLLQLVVSTILIAIALSDPNVRGVATYFAVPKGSGDKARAIFNGTRINQHMQPAPPMNVSYTREILLRMVKLDPTKGYYIITGDWRHWFHQFRLVAGVSYYFCIYVKGQSKEEASLLYRWSTLPMGTTWSPYVAQCYSWSLILWFYLQLPDEDWPFVISRDTTLEQPPAFLELKSGGFITMYLDNLIAIGNHEEMRKLNSSPRLFREKLNLTIKEWTMLSHLQWTNTPVTFLGVQVKRIKRKDLYVLCWRQPPEKIEAWQEAYRYARLTVETSPRTMYREFFTKLYDKLKPSLQTDQEIEDFIKLVDASFPSMTYRMLSKLIGRILWKQSISLLPLGDFYPAIRLLEKYMRQRHKAKASWDARITLTKEEGLLLDQYFRMIVSNQWMESSSQPNPSFRKFACSDASSTGWGYVIYESTDDQKPDTTKPVTCDGGQWKRVSGMAERHIFFKEFVAAKKCIQRILNDTAATEGSFEIVLGIDNTAVAHVLRNFYTSTEFIAQDLKDLCYQLKERKVILTIVNLRSEDNAADAPSRRRHPTDNDITTSARELAASQMLARLSGMRENAYDEAHAPPNSERASRLAPSNDSHSHDALLEKRKRVEDEEYSEVEEDDYDVESVVPPF